MSVGRPKANSKWPAQYIVPDVMRDYCMFEASSRGVGFGVIASDAGGLQLSDEWGVWCCSGCAIYR